MFFYKLNIAQFFTEYANVCQLTILEYKYRISTELWMSNYLLLYIEHFPALRGRDDNTRHDLLGELS